MAAQQQQRRRGAMTKAATVAAVALAAVAMLPARGAMAQPMLTFQAVLFDNATRAATGRAHV